MLRLICQVLIVGGLVLLLASSQLEVSWWHWALPVLAGLVLWLAPTLYRAHLHATGRLR